MSWLLDVGMGLLGMGGQQQTNRANRDLAREQMRFQERMSNTAAQRSVEDYRKAGLNPALAYDRGASSPSGASTVLGDATGAGIATAQQSRQLRASLDSMKAQAQHSRAAAGQATATQGRELTQAALNQQQLNFNTEVQPFQKKLAAAQMTLAQYANVGAGRKADQERTLHEIIAPSLSTARQISDLVNAWAGKHLKPRILPKGGK